MPPTTQLTTAEDLLRMPDDGLRYELVQGILIAMPPAGNIQGHQTMQLGWRLAQHVEDNNLGIVYAAETGFKLATDPDTVCVSWRRAGPASFTPSASWKLGEVSNEKYRGRDTNRGHPTHGPDNGGVAWRILECRGDTRPGGCRAGRCRRLCLQQSGPQF